jgi:hypothetical protein
MLTIPIMRRWLIAAAIGVALVLLALHPVSAHGYRHHVTHHHRHYRHRAAHGHRRGGKGHRRWRVSVRQTNLPAPTAFVALADRYVGLPNPTGFRGPWCGAFVGMIARRAGYFVPAGFRLAINWLHAGPRLPGPRPGALAVRRGHVALIRAVLSGGRIETDNGNFKHIVGRTIERASRYAAFVEPRRG